MSCTLPQPRRSGPSPSSLVRGGGIVLVLCGLLLGRPVWAQDASYSLPFSHPQSWSPAMAGMVSGTVGITVSHRLQNATDNVQFNTSSLSLNYGLRSRLVTGGMGLYVSTDDRAGFRTTQVQGALAYDVPLGFRVRYHHLRAGIQLGLVQRNLRQGSFVFADQFDGVSFNLPTNEQFSEFNQRNLDLSAGLLWYRTQKIKGNPEFNPYAGLALQHMNQPRITFQDGDPGEPSLIRYTALVGGKMRTRTPADINISILYMRQGQSDLLAGSLTFRYVFYEEGLWFGIPKAAVLAGLNMVAREHISLYAGVQFSRSWELALAYDLLINQRFAGSTINGGLQALFRYTIGGKNFQAPALPFPNF